MNQTIGFPARLGALRLLDAVLRRGETLDSATSSALRDVDHRPDRALAQAIAGEVLRYLPDLDALIDSATKNRLPDDAKARMALRIALAQTLRLDTPSHAAISTTLPLVDGGPRRLVHGVFGTLSRGEARLPEVPTLPDRLAMRWSDTWGGATVLAAAEAIAAPPLLDITLADPDETAHWCAKLEGTSLFPGHVRLARGAAIESLAGFAEGRWWVQDLAASLPARLLGAGKGEAALDLCSAPGGKAMQLASQGWAVTAVDQSKARLERLAENSERCQLPLATVVGDVRSWAPDRSYNAILLDAPCTATGVFRRHPDVIHRIGQGHIADMAALQDQLLTRAIDWLEPGGRLVFATCSLEPEEGEERIAALLNARADLEIEAPRAAEIPAGLTVSSKGWLRILPGALADEGGLDGFFMARIKRR